jgi:hypothetical protein
MKRPTVVVLIAFALVSGCAGTRTPKLAKCTGPFRYANPYGTVLPSLPISGQPAPAPAAAQTAAPATPSAAPATPPVDPPAPAKTGALPPHYPSC